MRQMGAYIACGGGCLSLRTSRRGRRRRNWPRELGGAARGWRLDHDRPPPGIIHSAAGQLRASRLDLATLDRRAHIPTQRSDRPRILHNFPEEAFAAEPTDVWILDDRRQRPSGAVLRKDVAAQVGLAERPSAEKQIRIAREPTPLWLTDTGRSPVRSEPYASSYRPGSTKHRYTIIPEPSRVWLAGAGDVLDPAAADREEHEYVDPAGQR